MLRSPRCLWQESYKGFCLHSADFISPTQDTICPAPTDIRYKWCHGMCCCASVDPMHNTIIPNFFAALGLFLHQPRENLINYSFHELIWELKCTACIFKAWRPQNPPSGVFFLEFALNATFQVVHISSPAILLPRAIYDSDPISLEVQND